MKGSRTLVIFRLGSIGDTLVALPCFHAIARAFPDHRRVLLTNFPVSSRTSAAEAVLAGSELIDEAIHFPAGDFRMKPVMSLVRELRRLKPEGLVYLVHRPKAGALFRDLAFFKAIGVPNIMGVPWSRELRQCNLDPVTLEEEYECLRLARGLRRVVPVGLEREDWDLRLTSFEIAKAQFLLESIKGISRTLIAVSPGTKVAAKDWGQDNWSALLQALAPQHPSLGLVLVGAREERELCDSISQSWKGPVQNLCGEVTPRETAAVLRHCHLMICHDSGPMHLAASQQLPCLALFGDYNRPRRWYPFGPGHTVIYEPRGIRAISVQRVADEIGQIFARRAVARPASNPPDGGSESHAHRDGTA
jgi:ADP-heptose:LPS heptosyltransferase